MIQWDFIWEKLLEHIQFSFIAILASVFIGMSLGILLHKTKWAKSIFIYGSSVLQVIPSIAIFGLLIPFISNLFLVVFITLISYGIFPILSNTIVALNSTSKLTIESATSIGLGKTSILFRIKLLSHLPIIISAIRITSSLLIGGASIAFTIGAGGLGEIINQGIQKSSVSIVLQGAIPIILLALSTNAILTLFKISFSNKGFKNEK